MSSESEDVLTGEDLASRWTLMWNGNLRAEEVVAPDCRVYFGRTPIVERDATVSGPVALQSVIDGIRARYSQIRYRHDSRPIFGPAPSDHAEGMITLLWKADTPAIAPRSGIDLLCHAAGRVTEVWSITGDHELPDW